MKTLNDLEKQLEKVENKIIQNVKEAQRESAEEILKDIKEFAPRKTGRYANSIKVYETETNGDIIETSIKSNAIVISSKGKIYNLGYLLEHGTSPHLIEPVYANVLHFEIDGKHIFAKRVHHPGSIAIPHYSIALNLNRSNYEKKLLEAIERTLNE